MWLVLRARLAAKPPQPPGICLQLVGLADEYLGIALPTEPTAMTSIAGDSATAAVGLSLSQTRVGVLRLGALFLRAHSLFEKNE